MSEISNEEYERLSAIDGEDLADELEAVLAQDIGNAQTLRDAAAKLRLLQRTLNHIESYAEDSRFD